EHAKAHEAQVRIHHHIVHDEHVKAHPKDAQAPQTGRTRTVKNPDGSVTTTVTTSTGPVVVTVGDADEKAN
ncbi:hypothetical protein KDL45_03265, partial [bacterium]|nr:hypothetical protein [bacterium]